MTSIELGPDSDWDYLQHSKSPRTEKRARFQEHLRQLQKSYWFSHNRFASNAKVVHGTVYDVKQLGINGEIGLLSNVLVHLRDPLRAIECLSDVVSETLIITDVEPYSESRRKTIQRLFSRTRPIAQFFGDHRNTANDHTWWHLSPKIVDEFVKILGFTKTKTIFFSSGLRERKTIHQWAIIAERADSVG